MKPHATRMQELLDKQDIWELSVRYMRGLDRLDADLMRDVFHVDSTVDYGFVKGRGEDLIVYAMRGLKDHVANHHMLGQALIEVDGDEAFGEVYFHAFHRVVPGGNEMDLIIAGRYVDRYTRRDGVWKIAHRSEVNDWSRSTRAADTYLAGSGCLLGERMPNDLSYRRDWLRAHAQS